jgi:hypothetical protein
VQPKTATEQATEALEVPATVLVLRARATARTARMETAATDRVPSPTPKARSPRRSTKRSSGACRPRTSVQARPRRRPRSTRTRTRTNSPRRQSAPRELEKDNEALQQATKDLRIENEFLASNKYTWHNPKRALQVADLSEVTITEDGKVEGLDKALDALAKSDPYLLKKSDGTDDGDGPDGKSGSGAGSGRKDDKKTVDKETLAKKYPALRR